MGPETRPSILASKGPIKVCFVRVDYSPGVLIFGEVQCWQLRGGPSMSPLRPLFVSSAVLNLSALFFVLGGCNSGSSTRSTGQPSYTLSATALNPASITAGNTSTSAITVTPADGYTGS